MNNQKPNEQKVEVEGMAQPEQQASSTPQRVSIQSRPILGSEASSNEPIVDGIAPQPSSGPVILRPQTTSNAPSATMASNNNLKPVDQNSNSDLKSNDMTEQAIKAQPDSDDNVSDSATGAPQAEDNTAPDEAQSQDATATTETVQRQHELQEYVKNRKYFVPVNIVGYKRSVKVSFLLVLVVILLGLVLLDLMLDSGMIYLVQNIPHTHFFNHLNQ